MLREYKCKETLYLEKCDENGMLTGKTVLSLPRAAAGKKTPNANAAYAEVQIP